MESLLSVLNHELADGLATLSAAGHDIEAAASFSKDKYMNSPKVNNLDNTMVFATKSLGTVAYHINKLAKTFVGAIGMQADLLAGISDRTEKLRMVIDIHQEKVARKSIGACSTQKIPIVFPHDGITPEPPQKYIRRPIDYTILESVGHGFHTQDPSVNQFGGGMALDSQPTGVRQHNTLSGRAVDVNPYSHYATSIHADTRFQSSTVGRTAGVYRTAVVPSQHMMPQTSGIHSPPSGPLSSVTYASHDVFPTSTGFPNQPILPSNQNLRSNDSSSVGSGSAYQQTHYTASQAKNDVCSQQQQISSGQFKPPPQQQQPFLPPPMLTTQQNPVTINYAQPTNQQRQQPHFNYQQQPITQASDVMDQMTLPPPAAYAGVPFTQPLTSASTGLPMPAPPIETNKHAADGTIRRQPNDPPWAPEFYLEKVVTLYDYEQTREDELTFNEDKIIYVVKKNDDDWWEGVMDGITGLFPGNYVERID